MTLTPQKSGYAPVNGVEVYYAVYGTGKPLLLLHGGLMTAEGFGPVLAALAAGRQVIAPHLQGHGHTLPFDRPMSAQAIAQDMAELIAFLGFDTVDVMGYSMGGLVATRLALDHPERVNRLVLTSAPFSFAGWHDANQQGMRSISAAAAEPMQQTPMYQAYAAVAPDVKNWPILLDKMGKFLGGDFDWSAEIPTIKAPTLVVVGDYDAVRISHATQFFELLGGGKQDAGWDGAGMTPARFAVLPGLTHYTIFYDTKLSDTAIAFLDA